MTSIQKYYQKAAYGFAGTMAVLVCMGVVSPDLGERAVKIFLLLVMAYPKSNEKTGKGLDGAAKDRKELSGDK